MTSTSVRWNDRAFTLQNFNDNFLLLRTDDGSSVAKLGQLIFEQNFDFIDEVIVTEVEVCLQLNERFSSAPSDWLATLPLAIDTQAKTYRLPVFFDEYEDWAVVTSTVGLSKSKVIAQLLAVNYSVAMFGFLPGFVYLDGLPTTLHVPRKAVPAKYVTANSIAIGGKYLGVYAIDSPGGWHVIGRVPVSILQLTELPPVPLKLADRIRLVEVEEEEFNALVADNFHLIEYNKLE